MNFVQHLYLILYLFFTLYCILFNILLPSLSPYIEEIIVDHRSRFQCNISSTDLISCFCQVIQNKWEYKESISVIF
jgi:hypothetical protein